MRQLYPLRILIDLLPGRSVNSLTPADLEHFKQVRARAISPVGARHDLVDLQTVLRWAYRSNLLRVPVYDRVKPFKIAQKTPAFFTPKQIDLIESFVTPEKDALIRKMDNLWHE